MKKLKLLSAGLHQAGDLTGELETAESRQSAGMITTLIGTVLFVTGMISTILI